MYPKKGDTMNYSNEFKEKLFEHFGGIDKMFESPFGAYVYMGIKNNELDVTNALRMMSEITFTAEEVEKIIFKKGNYQDLYRIALKALDAKKLLEELETKKSK